MACLALPQMVGTFSPSLHNLGGWLPFLAPHQGTLGAGSVEEAAGFQPQPALVL